MDLATEYFVYDADCSMCARLARWARRLIRRPVRFIDAAAAVNAGIVDAAVIGSPPTTSAFVTTAGVHTRARGIGELLRRSGLFFAPAAWLLRNQRLRPLADRTYDWVARHRSPACRLN